MFGFLFAQGTPAPAAPSAGGGWAMPLMMLAIFLIFYLLIIRPQSKKAKELEKRRNSLKKGDRVVTAGGIFATVSHLKDDNTTVVVEIADGVKVELVKSTIMQIVTPPDEVKK